MEKGRHRDVKVVGACEKRIGSSVASGDGYGDMLDACDRELMFTQGSRILRG